MKQIRIPRSFRGKELKASMPSSAKKATGPDKTSMGILQVLPALFSQAVHTMWEMMGRLGFVPSLLRSGTLSPIYKQDGEPSVPSNHRPICLISAFRKVIREVLTEDLEGVYIPEDLQLGYCKSTGTESPVTHATNNVRRAMPLAVLLDLQKAYDLVPTARLQPMVRKRVLDGLIVQLLAQLWPVVIRTKGQNSQINLVTRAGVPHGDPTSPQLFLIFMDNFIRATNLRPEKAITSLFVDDVLGLT